MKTFTSAFTEFISAQFVPNTRPRLTWFPNYGYRVTWYFSEATIKFLGGEILL